MSNSNKRGPYVKNDRFGNPFQVIGCKPNKNGFPVGYIELHGNLYKIEPSEAKGEGKYTDWVKVTKMPKRSQNSSM